MIQLVKHFGLLLVLGGVLPACGRCDFAVELGRIQSDQPTVLDCGRLVENVTISAARTAAACANQAIDQRRPFRVLGRDREASNMFYSFLSRVESGRYVVYALGHVDALTPADRIDSTACLVAPRLTVLEARDGTAQLSWDCTEIDRSVEARTRPYNPPGSIPNGLICPM
jgi:hypothetical protein